MMEPNACCVNCGKTLTVLTTWTSAVLNAEARLLGRLHDEEQVMNEMFWRKGKQTTGGTDMGEKRAKRLEKHLQRLQEDYDYLIDYIRENGEVAWEQVAKDFGRCKDCGYNYNEPQAESHFNWSHQECPVAFIQNCEDFVNGGGGGNSTRYLIQDLFDNIKSHGDMESEARSFHEVLWDCRAEGVPEDFDEYLKVSGQTMEDFVWEKLWGYTDDLYYINTRIVEYWMDDYRRDIGPLPHLRW